MNEETFKCPECGSIDCWFDREICIYEDGTEEGMQMRCNGCGKSFKDLFGEER